MDPLTQGLLGASFGQALCGRALGRSVGVWGALVGTAPDLDVEETRVLEWFAMGAATPRVVAVVVDTGLGIS